MTANRKNTAFAPRPESPVRSGICSCKRSVFAALFFLSSILCPLAAAEGISVNKAEMRPAEDGYQLSASYDIDLNAVVKQALSRGIPLYFVGEFSLTQARWDWLDTAKQAVWRNLPHFLVGDSQATRWSWLDKEIFKSEQAVKLSYSVLTGRYRISRGTLFQNFSSLEEALSMLARQSSASIPADLMNKEDSYRAAARLSLDIAQLPKPLQVNALTDNDWTLDSGWHHWVISASDIVQQKQQSGAPPQ